MKRFLMLAALAAFIALPMDGAMAQDDFPDGFYIAKSSHHKRHKPRQPDRHGGKMDRRNHENPERLIDNCGPRDNPLFPRNDCSPGIISPKSDGMPFHPSPKR